MSTQPTSYISPEEYLAIERAAERKSEYFDGQMYLMAGASEPHNVIASNALTSLGRQLRSHSARVYGSNMRVCIDRFKMYTYPDVVVACGDRRFLDSKSDTLLNPILILEVIPPSAEFSYYRSMESLQAYILVAADHIHAELYVRDPKDGWWLRDANRPDDILDLQCLGCTLKLADLYHKVEF